MDEAGRVVGLVGISHDITLRQHAEDQLHQLSRAVEQSPASVVISDTAGCIEYVNPKFCAVTGCTPAEVLGQNPRVLKSGKTSPEEYGELWRRITSGQEWRGEFHNRRKNGELYWKSAVISPIKDERGTITHFLAIKEDITERKHAQAEMAEMNKRLIDTSRLAGVAEVATGVLHNVGNVLNCVNVSATLVGDRLKKSKNAGFVKIAALLKEQVADLPGFFARDARAIQLPGYLAHFAQHLTSEQQTMLGEVGNLMKNIEHIKDIVAMQQSYAKVSGVTESIKPAELVEDTLRMNAGSFDGHAIEVVRELEDLPPIEADKHKVLQIPVIFVRNAKYACDDSRRADKRITVRVGHRDDRVLLSVIDNGVGIPAENLGLIFNPGFTTRKEGHGFGLHSAASAAKQMGGAVTVHSGGPGLGAVFTLELPLRPLPQNQLANLDTQTAEPLSPHAA